MINRMEMELNGMEIIIIIIIIINTIFMIKSHGFRSGQEQ